MEVRFRDLDALGHVNNAVLLTYVEQARLRWWEDFLLGRSFKDHGFLIARTEIDYRKPIFFHDSIRVELRCHQIGTSSFSLGFLVLREKDDVVLAEGQTVQVMLDFKTNRPRPISDEAQIWLKAQG